MSDTVSFLNTTFKGIRCQNPACQAEAQDMKRITLGNLLFTGWTCHYCGLVHTGALVGETGGSVDRNFFVNVECTTDAQVEEEIDKLTGAPTIEIPDTSKMKRPELVGELEKRGMKLADVPVSGKTVSNADIVAHLKGVDNA